MRLLQDDDDADAGKHGVDDDRSDGQGHPANPGKAEQRLKDTQQPP